jgi:hypothetical protein
MDALLFLSQTADSLEKNPSTLVVERPEFQPLQFLPQRGAPLPVLLVPGQTSAGWQQQYHQPMAPSHPQAAQLGSNDLKNHAGHSVLQQLQQQPQQQKQQQQQQQQPPLYQLPLGISVQRKTKRRRSNSSGDDDGGATRGKYKCSRCGLPKVGHECAFGAVTKAAATQCELRVTVDNKMPRSFVRLLPPRKRRVLATPPAGGRAAGAVATMTPESSILSAASAASALARVPPLMAGTPAAAGTTTHVLHG